MLESAINCQPDICISNGIASTGSETISDLDCDVNSCSDYGLSNGTDAACDRSDCTKAEQEQDAQQTVENSANDVDNSNHSDNRVITALNDEFTANLDLKDRNFCNGQNNNSNGDVDEDNAATNTNANNVNEDCDNLIEPVDVNNSQDCNRIVDELEVRLNGNGDISVETSVETIVDNNYSINSAIDNELK